MIEAFANEMEGITIFHDQLRRAERARHETAMSEIAALETSAVAECRARLQIPTKMLLGSGIVTWDSEERVSNRYGAFTLTEDNYNHDAHAPVTFDTEGLKLSGLLGKRVKITCLVTESRPSGHAGDKPLRLEPVQPAVGAIIEVGIGILETAPMQFANPAPAIMLRPEIDRAELWIDPRQLYQLHDQTVQVFIEATDEPCPAMADLFAETGVWANGDGSMQSKRVTLRDGMKVAPVFRPLGDGLFEVRTKFSDGESLNLIEPPEIDWKSVWKQALVGAIRNSPGNCGLSNLSRQSKSDLIEAAKRLIAAGPDYAASFRANLEREVAFWQSKSN